MPWLDYEEHVNWYRCQDTIFIERNSTFNSADFGLTFVSLLGGEMSEEYQRKVNNKYPSRYGSMAFGVYNGGGYHASEKNENKVLEGRLTVRVRPLPDIIPGFQLSYFGITGKGNKEEEPTGKQISALQASNMNMSSLQDSITGAKGTRKVPTNMIRMDTPSLQKSSP